MRYICSILQKTQQFNPKSAIFYVILNGKLIILQYSGHILNQNEYEYENAL